MTRDEAREMVDVDFDDEAAYSLIDMIYADFEEKLVEAFIAGNNIRYDDKSIKVDVDELGVIIPCKKEEE